MFLIPKFQQKGFTLVEILVALAIFSLFISSAMGIFISIVRHQRQVLAKQELLNQVSYAVEYMGRALRMAKKDSTGACINSGYNYKSINNGTGVRFINHMQDNECQEFFLQGEQLIHKKITGSGEEIILEMISGKFRIIETNLKFKIFGESETDDLQPRVTILLEAEAEVGNEKQNIKVQTTVSQRNLDVIDVIYD